MSQQFKIPKISQDVLSQFNIADVGIVHDPEALSYHRYKQWLDLGKASYLTYLSDERAKKRKSIKEVFPNFQSALVFLFPYKKSHAGKNSLKMADYVLAFDDQDYHHVLPQKIKAMLSSLEWAKDIKYQIIVDTAPVLERDMAYRAGLGWFGKNSMLINKYWGSYFLIASAIFEVKLSFEDEKAYEVDHCGSCRSCIEACPTNAILESVRQIDVEKCISSYSIELFTADKKAPAGSENAAEIYGCDICQSVCPWNSKITFSKDAENENSLIANTFLNKSLEEVVSNLEAMSKRNFKKTFAHTPIGRTGRDSVLKNIKDKIKIN